MRMDMFPFAAEPESLQARGSGKTGNSSGSSNTSDYEVYDEYDEYEEEEMGRKRG